MEKRFDICTYGELLIDFTESGLSNQGNPLYEANPGGAPCNVIAMLQKIGHKTAFIGKVGNDVFGRQLKAKTWHMLRGTYVRPCGQHIPCNSRKETGW